MTPAAEPTLILYLRDGELCYGLLHHLSGGLALITPSEAPHRRSRVPPVVMPGYMPPQLAAAWAIKAVSKLYPRQQKIRHSIWFADQPWYDASMAEMEPEPTYNEVVIAFGTAVPAGLVRPARAITVVYRQSSTNWVATSPDLEGFEVQGPNLPVTRREAAAKLAAWLDPAVTIEERVADDE